MRKAPLRGGQNNPYVCHCHPSRSLLEKRRHEVPSFRFIKIALCLLRPAAMQLRRRFRLELATVADSCNHLSVDCDSAGFRRGSHHQQPQRNQLSQHVHGIFCEGNPGYAHRNSRQQLFLRWMERRLYGHEHLQSHHDRCRNRCSYFHSRLWCHRSGDRHRNRYQQPSGNQLPFRSLLRQLSARHPGDPDGNSRQRLFLRGLGRQL